MRNIEKILIVTGAIFALFGLNGCGTEVSNPFYNKKLITLFLVDDIGNSYAGVPYLCDSMAVWDISAPNGAFSFYPGEKCTFDFTGLNGTTSNNPTIDNLIYIVDYQNNGQNAIPYECSSFIGVDYTFNDGIWDGSFDYAPNDACLFYL